jgi:phosphatidylglycerophosphate synthase
MESNMTQVNITEVNINPVEEMMMGPAKSIGGLLHENGFNRSGVTTLSLLIGLLAVKFIIDGSYIYAAICYAISHVLDHVEEEVSRKTGSASSFEKNFTMMKNLIVHGLVLYYIYAKYSTYEGCSSKNIFLVLLAFLVISFMQVGCRKLQNSPEEYANESIVGKIAMDVCPVTSKEDALSLMKFLRYFSETTVVIVITGLIAMMGEYA